MSLAQTTSYFEDEQPARRRRGTMEVAGAVPRRPPTVIGSGRERLFSFRITRRVVIHLPGLWH